MHPAQTDCFVVVKESHDLMTSELVAGAEEDRDGRALSKALVLAGERGSFGWSQHSPCDLRGEKRAVVTAIEEKSAT